MCEMITLERLKAATEDFFTRHWVERELGPKPTFWDGRWEFKGTVPNHDKPGCYALLSGKEVVYIGVGARRGAGRYEGMGLGARLTHVWKTKGGQRTGEYEPEKKWADRKIDAVATMGLPRKYGYLAYALEAFLISSLVPKYNVTKPGSSKDHSVGTS